MVVRSVIIASGGWDSSGVEGEGGSVVEGMAGGSEVSTSVMLVVYCMML